MFDRAGIMTAATELCDMLDTAQEYVCQLRAQNAALVAAVRAVEHIHGYCGDMFCPWCSELEPDHTSDCQRQAALIPCKEE